MSRLLAAALGATFAVATIGSAQPAQPFQPPAGDESIQPGEADGSMPADDDALAATRRAHRHLRKADLHSGYIPASCGTDPISSPNLLDCWLAAFPAVANATWWQRSSDGQNWPWPYWSSDQKAALRQAFRDAWAWHANGMTSFPGTPIPEPPTNVRVLGDNDYVSTVLDDQTAWALYLAYTANSLAAEIGGWVPWSLRSYDKTELENLLSGWEIVRLCAVGYSDDFCAGQPGYFVYPLNLTPAHPTTEYSFLASHGLIASTPLATVANLVDWSRSNLSHFLDAANVVNYDYHWHYRGLPPVSRILQGTILTNPKYAASFPNPEHWTAGCWGSTDFYRLMLRAVNIPVIKTNQCGHTTAIFPSIGRYLTHGDDPYSSLAKSTPPFPAEKLLIDASLWGRWFPDQNTACTNVGRQPIELNLVYPSDDLVNTYCSDVAAHRDHAAGRVYAVFQLYYSVGQLETAGLWDKLAAQAHALGRCQ